MGYKTPCTFLPGWVVIFVQPSIVSVKGKGMRDLITAKGTLSTSQINNDRGSLMAIYEPQSSWETYFRGEFHLNCVSAQLAQMYEVSKSFFDIRLVIVT